MKRICLSFVICVLAVVPLQAQKFDNFVAQIGAGFNTPVGPANSRLGNGFSFNAAAGPRFAQNASLLLDFSYNNLNVIHLTRNGFLSDTDDPFFDASGKMWSLTVNPEFEFVKAENWSWFAQGGYGVYNRRLNLKATTFSPAVVCDDWWDICTAGIVTGDEVIGKQSTYKGGFNVGTGWTFGSSTKFFADVRYHQMFTTNQDTQLFAFNFGVRW